MKLKVADLLLYAKARIRNRNVQLCARSLESDELRRIDAVSEVDTQRTNGCAVADAESDGVNHIVEIGESVLVNSERNRAEMRVDVTSIVKNDTADVVA